MKFKKLFISALILLIFTMSIGVISASDTLNDTIGLNDNVISEDNLESSFDDVIQKSKDAEILGDISSGKTITIEVDKNNPNQVLNPTIQPAIDAANPGDTIILKGDFVHCHFLINKTINIIASEATLGPCPHHQTEDAGNFGVFYVLEGGSGSTFSGVTFKNNARAETPFAFLIKGASDVQIMDCKINYPESDEFKYMGIIIENSDNIKLSGISINDTSDGISIINSTNVEIRNCAISNSSNQAISISGKTKNTIIKNSQIINNSKAGINLASADYVSILNNLIKDNGLNNYDSGSGIYVNTNITKLIVKGNLFLSNGMHAIMYDYRARNLNNDVGADNLTIVDNNYFEGHTSMILHHRIYVEADYGTIKYDEANDVYGDMGEGNYVEGKSYVYMQHAFVFNDVLCGFTYYTTQIPWAMEASANNGKYNLSLGLSNIKQVKNGVYQVSIVDCNGSVAGDFNSFDITFFLNGYSTMKPKSNDVYKKVSIQNGVATADFRDAYSSFNSSDNVIVAAFPGLSSEVDRNPHVMFSVDNRNIPIDPSTKLIATKLTTYPLSDSYFSVKLVDSKGNSIANQKITFKFNGKTYAAKTNQNGIAKVLVSLSSKKTYSVSVIYGGSDDYRSSQATSTIVVKTGSKKSKIVASSMKIKKNKKKSFKIKLLGSSGKALSNQKITVKLNSKTYIVKTNKKGIAKISIILKKVKKYKISVRFLGNANYKASSKIYKIIVIR